MITKMNLDVQAENEEEKEIEEFLNILHNSTEIQEFLNSIKEEANRRNVYKYSSRIKNVNSAIRTYRINKKSLKDVRDYIGIWFITNNEREIYPIVDYFKEKFPNAEYIDLVDEKSIYSPLVYIKWTPPLDYVIFAKESLVPNQMKVPIEIRITYKEAYISDQAAYFSVHKNDTTNLTTEERKNLRNIVQHITYKFALLNIRKLSEGEREKHLEELKNIIYDNYDFLKKNHDLCKDAVLVFGRTLYRCEHDDEITSDEKILTKSNIDDIDEWLKKKFSEFIQIAEGNLVDKIHEAVRRIRLIDYQDIKDILNIK